MTCPSPSRRRRSPPCSTRRRAWWSRRVRGSTSSRLLNSALTCLTNRSERTRLGLTTGAFQSWSHNSRGHCLDFICCPEGFKSLHLELSTSCSGVIMVISGSRILSLVSPAVSTPCLTLSRIQSWNQNKKQDRFVFFHLQVKSHCVTHSWFYPLWRRTFWGKLTTEVSRMRREDLTRRRWMKDDARLAFCDGDHWRDSSSDLGSVYSRCSCSHFLPCTSQSLNYMLACFVSAEHGYVKFVRCIRLMSTFLQYVSLRDS